MKLYQILECSSKKQETYTLMMEEKELTKYLNNHEIMNYGSRRDGLDPNYSIVAWEVGNNGQYYVDLDRIWRLYSQKVA